jgi:hypothetical protein
MIRVKRSRAKIFRGGGTPVGFRKQRSVVRRRHKNPIPITVARIVKAARRLVSRVGH